MVSFKPKTGELIASLPKGYVETLAILETDMLSEPLLP